MTSAAIPRLPWPQSHLPAHPAEPKTVSWVFLGVFFPRGTCSGHLSWDSSDGPLWCAGAAASPMRPSSQHPATKQWELILATCIWDLVPKIHDHYWWGWQHTVDRLGNRGLFLFSTDLYNKCITADTVPLHLFILYSLFASLVNLRQGLSTDLERTNYFFF